MAFFLGSLLINTLCPICNSYKDIRTNTILVIDITKNNN